MASEEVCRNISDEFLDKFPRDRVVTLLGYGSVVDGRSQNSDVDVYLLLDTWNGNDVTLANEVSHGIPNPVDLTLHYADELPERPEHFRLGKKSCLALSYLASAELLHGKNIPAEMFEQLDEGALRTSALHAVFYYLGQMRKEMSTSDDEATVTAHLNKYLARSIIDAMIFYKKMTYAPFRDLSSKDVIELAREHEQLARIFVETNEDIDTNTGKLEFMQRTHSQLRMANWLIRREAEMNAVDSEPAIAPQE